MDVALSLSLSLPLQLDVHTTTYSSPSVLGSVASSHALVTFLFLQHILSRLGLPSSLSDSLSNSEGSQSSKARFSVSDGTNMSAEHNSESETPVLDVHFDGGTHQMTLDMFQSHCRNFLVEVFDLVHQQQEKYKARIGELEAILASQEKMQSGSISKALPDPPKLVDGKELDFANWRYLMEQKFTANGDHFDTPACRLAYLINCTSGEALAHLLSRVRSKVLEPIGDVKDALDYLEMLYHWPKPKSTEFRDFRPPERQRSCFEIAFRVFVWNAVKSEIPQKKWRRKLLDYLEWKYDRKIGKFSPSKKGTLREYANDIYSHLFNDEWEDLESECFSDL